MNNTTTEKLVTVTTPRNLEGTKPLGESGGHTGQKPARQVKVEWMETENLPIYLLLKEILETLKRIESRLR